MKKYLPFIIFIFSSCFSTTDKHFVIKGEIVNLKTDSVFLANAYKWDSPISWSKVDNDKFSFNIDRSFKDEDIPLLSVGYKDQSGKFRLFEFINHVLSPNSDSFLYSAFILDTPKIEIIGNIIKSPYLEILAGQETAAMYASQLLPFGYFSGDEKNHEEQLQKHLEVVKKYPDSKFLLSTLYSNKSSCSKADLRILLSSFSQKLSQSKLYKKLFEESKEETSKYISDTTFVTATGSLPLLDKQAKATLIVFWASWCAPCRKEIPDLKNIYNRYNGKGLLIRSISIDDKHDDWIKAVDAESMEWPQILLNNANKVQFLENVGVQFIPHSFLVDSRGKVLHLSVGNDSFPIKHLTKEIEKLLN